MERVCVVLLCCQLVLAAASVSPDQLAEEWRQWKMVHKKGYRSEREEGERYAVWLANREFIMNHNTMQKEHGYSLSLNHFADLVGNSFSVTIV